MNFKELEPVLQEVLNNLSKKGLIELKPNKITRILQNPIAEANIKSKDYIAYIYPNANERLQRRLWYRILDKCLRYMQYNTLHKLYLNTKAFLERETPPPLISSAENRRSNFGKNNVGSNLRSELEVRLPKDFSVKMAGDTRIHRVQFLSKNSNATIPSDSSLYRKIKSKIPNFSLEKPMNYLKLKDFTLGLSKKGKLQLFVKCNLENSTDLFVQQFSFLSYEEATLFLGSLKPKPVIEVGMPYIKGVEFLKDSKVKVTIPKGIGQPDEVIWLWEDGSDTLREIEVKGNGRTAYNLAIMIADRLRLWGFMEDTKLILAKIQNLIKFVIELILSS